jgi:cytochrome c
MPRSFGPILVVALLTIAAGARAEGDAAAGAKVFARCMQCHTLEPGKNRVGPSLAGVFGRAPGAVEGFNYSPEYREAAAKGLRWSEDALVKYLENPRRFLADFLGQPTAKTRMAFTLPKAEERQNVVAYLKQAASK